MRTSINVVANPTASGWTCEVAIETEGNTVSQHTVEVTAGDLQRYGRELRVEDLVQRSFDFLLEREPPSSILRRFRLPDIERYFPEYPRAIRA